MWRWVVGILLVANVFVGLVWSGKLDGVLPDGREPERLGRQAEADRLRVVGGPGGGGPAGGRSDAPGKRSDTLGLRPDAAGARSEPLPSRGDAGQSVQAPTSAATPMVLPGETCAELGPFDDIRAQRVRGWLSENVGVLSAEAHLLEEHGPWLVYLAPAPNAADAQLRLAALKRQGVQDLYVMQEGSLRWGISLGLFRTEEGARGAVDQLTRAGVRNVLVTRRGGTGEHRTLFRIRYPSRNANDDNGPAQRLAGLQRELGIDAAACGTRTVADAGSR